MRKTSAAVCLMSALFGFSGEALAQCQHVGFTAQGGAPTAQGFTAVGTPLIDLLPNGEILWTINPGTAGMFAPPNPPWSGEMGTRQEVRCTMRVVSSPAVLTPGGVHDSGFSIYRGRCIQGGDVVAGVTDDSIFISIADPSGVEAAYFSAPFDTNAEPAVYHFVATDHGQFLTATSGARTANVICPVGRYSGANGSWRVGGAGLAPAQVEIVDWTIARGLAPMVVASSPDVTACTALPAAASVTVSNQEGTGIRWQVRDAENPQGWRDITDGPLFINGTRWGTVTGSDTTTILFIADTANNRAPFQHRAVVTTACGSAASTPGTLRLLPDFNADGAVNTVDLLVLLGNFGSPVQPYCCGDIDGDGLGDVEDLVAMLGFYGQACE